MVRIPPEQLDTSFLPNCGEALKGEERRTRKWTPSESDSIYGFRVTQVA